MTKTRINCPNCRQPILADVDQLLDVNQDPAAKQRLLSGAFNMVQCPLCGYQGSLSSPIVYHDPEKELLLTFIPAELGLPQTEQERLIGSLINQVINKLPQEKRKAYLLQPQSTLTLQGLLERVLEADGITREMIQAQQQRLNLIQRLISVTDESVLAEIARQEDTMIDAEFFALLSRLAEGAMMSGDRGSAQRLADLQRSLLPLTSFGRQVEEQSKEVEAAIADLRSAGEGLTREKMLELVANSPNETRLRAYVSLARPVMDYTFFQLLSERIDRARGDGRNRLIELRGKLLEMTQEIDRQLEEHLRQTARLIDAILQAQDVRQAAEQSLQFVDEIFIQEVRRRQEEARSQGDLETSGRLQTIVDVINEASSSPPEVALVEEYLELADGQAQLEFLTKHQDQITTEFMDVLSGIVAQIQGGEDQELADHILSANRLALRFSMQKSLRS